MMMTDPGADPQGGAGQGTGAGETPDPRDAEIQRLKSENAEARETNRREHAEALGAKHGLTPTMTELVASQDRDKQDTYAEALVAELKGQQAPAAPTPPAGEPAAPATPAAPDPGTDPALQHMQTGGEATPVAEPTPVGWRAQMNEEMNKAESFEQFTEIQARYQKIAAEEGGA